MIRCSKDLIVFQKAYDSIRWTHELTAKYPKSERFVLTARTQNEALELLSAIIEANESRDKAAALGAYLYDQGQSSA